MLTKHDSNLSSLHYPDRRALWQQDECGTEENVDPFEEKISRGRNQGDEFVGAFGPEECVGAEEDKEEQNHARDLVVEKGAIRNKQKDTGENI